LTAVDPPEATTRTTRGGGGNVSAADARVTVRINLRPDEPTFEEDNDNPNDAYNWIGFRLVRRAP
jgi:hypothetical protein